MKACLLLACALVLTVSGLRGGEPRLDPRVEIVQTAAALAAEADWLDDEARAAYVNALQASADAPPSPQRLQTALRAAYPAYREAMVAYQMERNDLARERLLPLAGHVDPYLATHAAFHLAAIDLREERYEDALPLLDRILTEHMERHLFFPDLLLYRAEALAHLLRVGEAMQMLHTYQLGFPEDDPARQRHAAGLLARLAAYRQGTITEADLLMAYSRRRLHLLDPGATTQAQQKKILAILDETIKQLEEQQDSSSGQGQGQGQGQGTQQQGTAQGMGEGTGAQDSALPDGAAPPERLGRAFRGEAGEVWGRLPAHEREEIENHLRERFPQRYREIIEAYFIHLQKDDVE